MMAFVAAIASAPLVTMAITGFQIEPWCVALAGFSCGYCWAIVYAKHVIKRAFCARSSTG
jgi:hypothetical protein